LTGEHSVIMIRTLSSTLSFTNASWLPAFEVDTKRRLVSLLGSAFRHIETKLASSILYDVENSNDDKEDSVSKQVTEEIQKRAGTTLHENSTLSSPTMTSKELFLFLTQHDLKRLDQYGRNLCDHHLIADLLPNLARLYFLNRFDPSTTLSSVQALLLIGVGLQFKTVEDVSFEIRLPTNQVLSIFNKTIRKLSLSLKTLLENEEKESSLLTDEKRREVERSTIDKFKDVTEKTLEVDTAEDAQFHMDKALSQYKELSEYAIKGSEEQWNQALQNKDVEGNQHATKVQIKRIVSRKSEIREEEQFLAKRKKEALKKLEGDARPPKKSKKKERHSS